MTFENQLSSAASEFYPHLAAHEYDSLVRPPHARQHLLRAPGVVQLFEILARVDDHAFERLRVAPAGVYRSKNNYFAEL